ncbi:hypothetical protein Aph02nite_50900 [Actinoplanes philippinensis]|uniref:Uncharacterized protein n=1 Tax=Actinoplanes philippinensis TaxID=35752 RepID=A0A1I2INB9_9ACTN|nr:hypothetical protein [Actinoplanes philippinensis]GIE79140.1 hypothetical protein Aph02nite_50900 [Actinoplanes philippinensis]SFF43805.1 hypothetical protein SAMN05421541_110268 [Actinoplanes philippinensis]
MRYATPSRSAHRAAPAGGLNLPIRFPARGQHRRRSRRHLRREPLTTHLFTRGLAGLIVLGIVVMLGVLFVADDRRPPAQLASAEVDARIATREVDPAPLSEAEVFPGDITAFGVTRTDLTADCSLAAGGALRTTLQRYGCSQAVRAALTVPYADYRITAGMLNLPDTTSAMAVGDQIRYLVETGDGGFTEMSGATTGLGAPVAWRTRGHYVMYCVITGPSGELVAPDAPQVTQLTRDVLDTHLHDSILIRRAS